MVSNPGQRVTLYEIAEVFGQVYNRQATITKAMNAFKKCGIWPLNRNMWTADDFAIVDIVKPQLREERGAESGAAPCRCAAGAAERRDDQPACGCSAGAAARRDDQPACGCSAGAAARRDDQPACGCSAGAAARRDDQPACGCSAGAAERRDEQPACGCSAGAAARRDDQPACGCSAGAAERRDEQPACGCSAGAAEQRDEQPACGCSAGAAARRDDQSADGVSEGAAVCSDECSAGVSACRDEPSCDAGGSCDGAAARRDEWLGQDEWLTLLDLSPLPVNKCVKTKKICREKVRSEILTTTPVKKKLEEKEEKRRRRCEPKTKRGKRKIISDALEKGSEIEVPVTKVARKVTRASSATEVQETVLELKVGSYVLVRYDEPAEALYIGKVIEAGEEKMTVSFMKRSNKFTDNFMFPDNPDVAVIDHEQVVRTLPDPQPTGGTKRAGRYLTFRNVELSDSVK